MVLVLHVHTIHGVFCVPAVHYTGLPSSKRQQNYLGALLLLLICPTHHKWACFSRWSTPTTLWHSTAGLCKVVPYEHDRAQARDGTFLPKSVCQLQVQG